MGHFYKNQKEPIKLINPYRFDTACSCGVNIENNCDTGNGCTGLDPYDVIVSENINNWLLNMNFSDFSFEFMLRINDILAGDSILVMGQTKCVNDLLTTNWQVRIDFNGVDYDLNVEFNMTFNSFARQVFRLQNLVIGKWQHYLITFNRNIGDNSTPPFTDDIDNGFTFLDGCRQNKRSRISQGDFVFSFYDTFVDIPFSIGGLCCGNTIFLPQRVHGFQGDYDISQVKLYNHYIPEHGAVMLSDRRGYSDKYGPVYWYHLHHKNTAFIAEIVNDTQTLIASTRNDKYLCFVDGNCDGWVKTCDCAIYVPCIKTIESTFIVNYRDRYLIDLENITSLKIKNIRTTLPMTLTPYLPDIECETFKDWKEFKQLAEIQECVDYFRFKITGINNRSIFQMSITSLFTVIVRWLDIPDDNGFITSIIDTINNTGIIKANRLTYNEIEIKKDTSLYSFNCPPNFFKQLYVPDKKVGFKSGLRMDGVCNTIFETELNFEPRTPLTTILWFRPEHKTSIKDDAEFFTPVVIYYEGDFFENSQFVSPKSFVKVLLQPNYNNGEFFNLILSVKSNGVFACYPTNIVGIQFPTQPNPPRVMTGWYDNTTGVDSGSWYMLSVEYVNNGGNTYVVEVRLFNKGVEIDFISGYVDMDVNFNYFHFGCAPTTFGPLRTSYNVYDYSIYLNSTIEGNHSHMYKFDGVLGDIIMFPYNVTVPELRCYSNYIYGDEYAVRTLKDLESDGLILRHWSFDNYKQTFFEDRFNPGPTGIDQYILYDSVLGKELRLLFFGDKLYYPGRLLVDVKKPASTLKLPGLHFVNKAINGETDYNHMKYYNTQIDTVQEMSVCITMRLPIYEVGLGGTYNIGGQSFPNRSPKGIYNVFGAARNGELDGISTSNSQYNFELDIDYDTISTTNKHFVFRIGDRTTPFSPPLNTDFSPYFKIQDWMVGRLLTIVFTYSLNTFKTTGYILSRPLDPVYQLPTNWNAYKFDINFTDSLSVRNSTCLPGSNSNPGFKVLGSRLLFGGVNPYDINSPVGCTHNRSQSADFVLYNSQIYNRVLGENEILKYHQGYDFTKTSNGCIQNIIPDRYNDVNPYLITSIKSTIGPDWIYNQSSLYNWNVFTMINGNSNNIYPHGHQIIVD